MTCIAGFANDGKIWIGGDSAGVSGSSLLVRKDSKVFRNGDYLFGITSSFRMGQLLQYGAQFPVAPYQCDLSKFMCTTFVDAVRHCLKEGGFAKKESETESGGTFLVGVNGLLFAVYSDYQVEESTHEFAAVGCGDQVALGAFHAMREMTIEPEARVTRALEAAEAFSSGVRGPFTILRNS